MNSWNYPTAIRFGVGAIDHLATAARELGIQRPIIVTDPGLATLPPITRSRDVLTSADMPHGLFHDMKGNPVGRDVDAGVLAYHAGNHDGVIAIGGGSALDVGKAVALMVGQTRPLWDFEDREDWSTRVDVGGMAPCVAVPTTAGTGSEVGRSSVIVDEDTHAKKIIFHANMLPGRVIADPALTAGLPAKLTAATGVDALSHNLEALCSPGHHPQADGIAIEGIRLIHRSLIRAVRDGRDLDARSDMLAASLMGATAFQKGLGAMHSLAHPIGARHDLHHGLLNAVVMPYVLTFNRSAIEAKMTRLARYLDLANPGFDAVLNWVLALRAEVGIPHTLGDLGLTEDHIADLAPLAVVDPTAGGNPIQLTVDNVTTLLRSAIHGQ
jgi:alcohol dehydrogenase class IV